MLKEWLPITAPGYQTSEDLCQSGSNCNGIEKKHAGPSNRAAQYLLQTCEVGIVSCACKPHG